MRVRLGIVALVPVLAGEPAQARFVVHFIATIRGDAAPVGPTPMERRKDAKVGSARLVLAIDRIGRSHGADGRSNAPHIEVYPNVRGVIASVVKLSCDVRHSDVATVCRMEAELRDTAGSLGYKWRDILSVAGHDAVSMNTLCPTAMIFAPSRADGISHNEREYSTPEDLAAAANVLLHAVPANAGARQAIAQGA